MKWIIVQKRFKCCVNGAIHPTEFEVSEKPIEVHDRTAQIAIENAWAKESKAPKADKQDHADKSDEGDGGKKQDQAKKSGA